MTKEDLVKKVADIYRRLEDLENHMAEDLFREVKGIVRDVEYLPDTAEDIEDSETTVKEE